MERAMDLDGFSQLDEQLRKYSCVDVILSLFEVIIPGCMMLCLAHDADLELPNE
jgi:hypothetical protein